MEKTMKSNEKLLLPEIGDMFCYQCEQTVGGKGCVKVGVCGKGPDVAAIQDLLVAQSKGIAFYAMDLIGKGVELDSMLAPFLYDAMFTTLTNVSFDPEDLSLLVNRAQSIKEVLRAKSGIEGPVEAVFNAPTALAEQLALAPAFSVLE